MGLDLDALVADFRRDGFCVIRGALDAGELAALQEETWAQIAAGPDREPSTDFMMRRVVDGDDLFFRIQTLHDRPLVNDSTLRALAHPVILELSRRLMDGADITHLGNAMVWKGPDGGPPIDVHRDSFPTAEGHVPDLVNVDLYLDAATVETGCLYVLPGSHRRADVRAEMAAGFTDEFVPVPMAAGDVLFHSAMVLHGSHPTPKGGPLRRVFYVTYDRADRIRGAGPYPGLPVSDEWVAQNMALIQHAARRRGFEWSFSPEWQELIDRVPFVLRPVSGNLPWETGRMKDTYLEQPAIRL